MRAPTSPPPAVYPYVDESVRGLWSVPQPSPCNTFVDQLPLYVNPARAAALFGSATPTVTDIINTVRNNPQLQVLRTCLNLWKHLLFCCEAFLCRLFYALCAGCGVVIGYPVIWSGFPGREAKRDGEQHRELLRPGVREV